MKNKNKIVLLIAIIIIVVVFGLTAQSKAQNIDSEKYYLPLVFISSLTPPPPDLSFCDMYPDNELWCNPSHFTTPVPGE
jgi:hypothetical protein